MNGTAMEWKAKAREQFETVLHVLETEWAAGESEVRKSAQEAAREHLAEWLNQGVRRLRQATDAEQAGSLAVELAAAYSKRCAIFLFRDGGAAEATAMRCLGEEPLRFDSNEAAAFRAAVETKDPVVAIGTAAEVSAGLSDRLDGETPERVFLFPLATRGGVKGVLFATGVEQPAVLELIGGVTALQMDLLDVPPVAAKRQDLIGIAGAANTGRPARSWNDLSPEEQALHLRAQRFARRVVAEIRLAHAAKVREGIARSNLYTELRAPIDKGREEFRSEFLPASPTMVDYFYLELVRGLAQDDDHLLGPEFPGRLI